MNDSEKLCPDCVEQLKPDKKKLGSKSNWFVCPTCGYRTRDLHYLDLQFDAEKMRKMKDRINNNETNFYLDKS